MASTIISEHRKILPPHGQDFSGTTKEYSKCRLTECAIKSQESTNHLFDMSQPSSRSSWRFLDTGFLTGYENMAIDEAIFTSCQQKKSPPTIRVYGWTPPAVSLGYFQKAENAVDVEACKRHGVDVVRRLSGGRAVLHHRELTYSIICREGTPPFGSSVLKTYKTISECLISTLEDLGLTVQWVTSRDRHTACTGKG